MKKTFAGLLLAGLVALAVPVLGQEAAKPDQIVIGQAARDMSIAVEQEIALELWDGTRVTGILIRADEEAIEVRRAILSKRYPYRDIRKAVVSTERKASAGVLAGAAAGLIIGNGLVFGGFSKPGNYLRPVSFDEYALLAVSLLAFIEAACAGIGGGIGAELAAGTSRRSFEFPEDPEALAAAKAKFLLFIHEGPPQPRFHLNVQGGWVHPKVSLAFDAALAEAGLADHGYWADRSRFSILRSIELSRSLMSWLRAGVRVSFPGEPARQAHLSEDAPVPRSPAMQTYAATAIHAVFAVEPFGRKRPASVSWMVGAGAGAAWIRLQRGISATSDPGQVTSGVEVKETLMSGLFLTFLQIRLNRLFSIGVAADYTFIPAVTVPPTAELGLPAQEVRLSNSSFGFVLGYHF
jgi:hypothetical protein